MLANANTRGAETGANVVDDIVTELQYLVL